MENIISRTHIDPLLLDINQTEIEFLGCGQDIYEVGKPHLYYKVTLKNISRQDYLTHLIHNKNNKKVMDQDKCIHVAIKDSLKFVNDHIQFTYYCSKIL